MKVMIEKVFSIKALLSLLLVFAAGGAWAEADYINANFYYVNSGNAYTAVTKNNDQSDSDNSNSEGWSSYAVQGKYWNDVDIGSSAAQSVKTYDSSAGSTSESSVTVTISGSRGGYFSAGGFDHHILSGYIDDNADNTSPLVTFANIPFDYYKVVVYFAADRSSTMFGYITLNDTVNLYGDGTGTDIGIDADGWGGCAPHVSNQNNFQPGQNILVSPVLKNTASSTLKVQSRSYWPGATYRSGIAAIQVVKAEAPAACTYTVSEGGTYDLFGSGATSYWSASEPSTGSEAVTISISGDTTLTVNDSRVFASLTVTGSGTLTLAGTGEIITPLVTVDSGVSLVKTSGQISPSAAVAVSASSAFEIANSCTWSGVISGAGLVKVSANPVTFSAANTYTGGLVVASGGLAKSENSAGWGSKIVMAVTVQSGGTLDISGEYSTGYNFFIAGTGVDSQGALVNSAAITYGGNLPGNLTLSADATIDCFNAFGVGGGKSLNLNGHILTIKSTSAETAKQFYVHGSYMNGGTIANTGKIVLQSNVQLYSNNGNGISSGQQAILLEAQSGSSVLVGASSGNFPVSNTTIADGAALTVDGTLNLQNGKTLTVNGTANISGTANIGQSGNAGSHLVVGGTVNVNGSGTIKLVSTSNITKNGSGVINIAANAQVWWINCHWTSTVGGDIFRGDGTLYLDSSGGNWSHSADTDFAGKIKWSIPSGRWGGITGSTQFANRAAFNLSDSGQLEFGENYASRALTVRDFEGGGTITVLSSHSATGEFKVDTLQSNNTIFSGVFAQRANNRNTGLTVRGEEGDVKSLTLSGASTTTGSATVQDNARLIFSSEGSWANGTVAVADGGYLEVNNPSAVASTLDLQSGGTIKIATYTTTETVGEEEVETLHTRTITAGTVTFPDLGEAVIDVSAIPDLATDEEVTIITATTSLDSDIANIRPVGKPYALKVDGNSLKVVNDGGLVWDSTNGWNGKDVTKYGEATITSPGTVALNGTSLAFDTLTIGGSGTVSFSATGDETITVNNIVIGSGVTLDASAALSISAGATISGEGTLDIPVGTTCTMNGVTCSAKVTVEGTLRTTGTTNLSAANTSAANSLIEVVAGTTTLSSEWQGIAGDITVDANATLAMSKSLYNGSDYYYNHIAPGGNSRINVTGTIALGSSYFWNFGANVKLLLHKNGEITGSRTDYGSIGWTGNGSVVVDGDATINAPIRINDNISPILTVEDNVTLTISKAFLTSISNPSYGSVGGSITKAGAGTLDLTAITPTKPITINAGTVVADEMPTTTITIDENGTFTLKDCAWTGNSNVFVGTGTLYLNYTKTTNDKVDHSVTGSTFSGTLKVGVLSNKAAYFNQNPALQLTGNPTLRLECGTQESPGSFYLGNSAIGHTLSAKNLSGWGIMTPWFGVNGTATFNIEQTDDTEFFGTFIDWQGTSKKLGLTVSGGSTVKSLTLSGENTTSGPLAIQNNAKVVFSGSGSWLNGMTTVKEGGVLESQRDAQVVGNLTLEDGSTLSFAEGYSLQVGAITLPASGTVTLDVSKLTLSDSGTTLMTFTTAPSADDVASKLTVTDGELRLVGTVLKVYPSVTYVARYGGQDYETIAEAIAAAELAGETYASVTILDESAECPAGYYLSGTAGSKTLTRCAARSGEEGSYVYYNDVHAILAALYAQKDLVLNVLDGNGAEYESALKVMFFPTLTYNETDQTLYIVVAKIGETGYRSFASAIDAATSGQTIELVSSSSEAITLDKTIILSGASFFSGTFTGTGKVTLDALMQKAIVAAGWSGTVVLPAVSGVLNLAYYGVSGSTVELTSMSGHFQHTGSTYSFNIEPNIKVSGSCTVNLSEATEGLYYSFQTISGTGTLTLNNNANSISVAKVSDFSGSIVNNSATALTIARLELSAAPTAGQCVLTTGGTGTVNVSSVYVGNTQQDVILEKKTDGIYVAATAETETVGEDTVTVLDTGSNTAIDATGVSGKVAIPGTVTQISGVEAANLLLKVTYTPDDGDSTTGYYAGILTLNSGNVSLNPSGSVTIDEETVNVKPAVAASEPMTMPGATTAPSFNIKTIPGLYYVVRSGTSPSSLTAGSATQATTTTTTGLAGPALGNEDTVRYYKISVGRTAAEAAQ